MMNPTFPHGQYVTVIIQPEGLNKKWLFQAQLYQTMNGDRWIAEPVNGTVGIPAVGSTWRVAAASLAMLSPTWPAEGVMPPMQAFHSMSDMEWGHAFKFPPFEEKTADIQSALQDSHRGHTVGVNECNHIKCQRLAKALSYRMELTR